MQRRWGIDKFLTSVTFTPAVVGYLRDSDKVCLGVRKKVSAGLGENLIAGIGGKVGDTPEIQNETSEEAMDREADEEIRVKVVEKQEMGRIRFTELPLEVKINLEKTPVKSKEKN